MGSSKPPFLIGVAVVGLLSLSACSPVKPASPTTAAPTSTSLVHPEDYHSGDIVDKRTAGLLAQTDSRKFALFLRTNQWTIVDPAISMPPDVRDYVLGDAAQYRLGGADGVGYDKATVGLIKDDASFREFLNRESTELRKPIVFLVRVPGADPDLWHVLTAESTTLPDIPAASKAVILPTAQKWADQHHGELFVCT